MNHAAVLELRTEKRANKTIVADCYYEGALKITRPVYLDGTVPTVYLIHVGGGFVDGDCYRMKIDLDEQSHLALTTQSSTKVYRTPMKPVRQLTEITLKTGSVLEYFPDPLIAYKDSRFLQETTIHKEEGAILFFSDIITPGWAEDGSLFQYEWIRSRLKIYQGNKLIVHDHVFLEGDIDPQGLLTMEGFTHVGSFFIVEERVDKDFVTRLQYHLQEYVEEARFGISLLPIEGCLLRILAHSTGVIEKIISAAHLFAREELLDMAPVDWRKY